MKRTQKAEFYQTSGKAKRFWVQTSRMVPAARPSLQECAEEFGRGLGVAAFQESAVAAVDELFGGYQLEPFYRFLWAGELVSRLMRTTYFPSQVLPGTADGLCSYSQTVAGAGEVGRWLRWLFTLDAASDLDPLPRAFVFEPKDLPVPPLFFDMGGYQMKLPGRVVATPRSKEVLSGWYRDLLCATPDALQATRQAIRADMGEAPDYDPKQGIPGWAMTKSRAYECLWKKGRVLVLPSYRLKRYYVSPYAHTLGRKPKFYAAAVKRRQEEEEARRARRRDARNRLKCTKAHCSERRSSGPQDSVTSSVLGAGSGTPKMSSPSTICGPSTGSTSEGPSRTP